MAIKWSQTGTGESGSHISWNKTHKDLLNKPTPAPAPQPVKQLDPLQNTKNLFATQGFSSKDNPLMSQGYQVYNKVMPTAVSVKPPVVATGQSRRDPFDSLVSKFNPVNTNIANSTPTAIGPNDKSVTLNDIIGAPVGGVGAFIGGAVGAIGGSVVAQNKGLKGKDYWNSIGKNSIDLAKEMYKNGSEVGAAGTKLGVASAVALPLVEAYFLAATGIGIFNAVMGTVNDVKKMKSEGVDKNVYQSINDNFLKNSGAEGFRVMGLDENTISSLNDNSFFNAVGTTLLFGGAFLSAKGLKGQVKPSVEKFNKLSDFLTKEKIVEYKLPETVRISPQELRDIVSGKDIYENNLTLAEKNDLFKTLALSGDERKALIDNKQGLSIERPTEVVIKLADKPWFAKIKKTLNIEPVEKVIGIEKFGVGKQAPAGLIEDTSSVPKDFVFAGQENLVPKTPALETSGLDFNAPPIEAPAPVPTISAPSNRIELTTNFDVNNPLDPMTRKAAFESETIAGLQQATAGTRTANGTGIDKTITGVKSTFPSWIPNQYRKSAIVKPVAEHIINGTMPETKAQLDFYKVVKDKFDNFGKETVPGKEISVDDIKFEKKQPKSSEISSESNQSTKISEKASSGTKNEISSKSASSADKGTYAEDVKGKGKSDLQTIETPEQYRLAKSIGSNMRFIMKNSSRYNGYFRPAGLSGEEIAMNRKLYQRGKDESKESYQLRIGKTMAHEIGHFIDYLPEGDLKRGNLIGRLQSLSNFKQNFIAEPELLKQRQELMRKINEINKNDELLDSMQDKLTAPLYKELTDLNRSITFNNPAFKDELVKLTHKWKPWVEGENPGYDSYRKSAAELYADFNSVLFNDPALAQEIAPRFYNEFFNALGKKPEVEKAFLGIQSELMGDKTTLMTKRYEMLKESGQNAQGRFAAMIAEQQLAKTSNWKNTLLTQMWYQHRNAIKGSEERKFLMERFDKGTTNFIELFGNQKIQPIVDKINKAGLSYKDIDAILKLERIAKDITRENVANIQGLDVKTAGDVLDELTNILGKEKAEQVLEIAKELRLALKELQLMYPDLFTPEQLELIKSNDFYAVFNVLYGESKNIYHSIKQSSGNIDKDFNTFSNMLVRSQSVIKFGERNKIKKGMIDSFLLERGDAIKKAKVSFVKRADGGLDRKVKKPELNWDIVEIKRNGKLESYYLPQDIADSLNNTTTGDAWVISKYLRKVNKPFKFLYTGPINASFMAVNFVFRDAPKAGLVFDPIWKRANTGKSNAGVGNFIANNTTRLLISKLNQIGYYRKVMPLLQDKNRFGKYVPITMDAMKDGIIKVDSKGYFNGLKSSELSESDQAGIKLVLQASGVLEEGGKRDKFTDKVTAFAQTLEETPKLAAYMYMRDLGILNEKNLSVIRNNVGSPNFDTLGSKNKDTSAFAFFYNPMIQGYRNMVNEAFIKDSAGKSSRQAFWTRKIRGAVIPAMLVLAAEEGMFGDTIKKWVNALPEYIKSAYIPLPIGVKENGQVKYLKMPLNEDTRLIYSLTRLAGKLVLHSGDAEERKNFLLNIVTFTGGQIPSQTPLFTISNTWKVGIFGNGNPYDAFRGQNIFYENEMRDMSKKDKAIILAKWTFNQNGILKVALRDSVDNRTIWEKAIVTTPVLSRLYGETEAGVYEQDQKVVDRLRQAEQVERAKKNKVVINIVEKIHKDPGYNSINDVVSLAKDRLGAEAEDSNALVAEVKTLNSAIQEEYVTSFGDIHYRSIMNQSNDVKQGLLVDIYNRKEMTDKEYLNFLLRSKSLGILSTEVIANTLIETGVGKKK